MGVIDLTANSVVIDGQKTWLISGAVHYFRLPRQMWRSCFEKCRHAGLNCIETYVAWNVHEREEGVFDFEGDRDLVHFVRLAHEMGLWVILRVGPYICAEHRLGGYPTWLLGKDGIALREVNAVLDRYTERWMGQLLPRVADLQVTRGGPIILVQNENEYAFPGRPGGDIYLRALNDLVHQHKIDVPLITCNGLTLDMSGCFDCYNGRDDFTLKLNAYACAQPDVPRIVSEYYPGWFDTWHGLAPRSRTPREIYRDVMDITANGGMVNYYMYAGGTNFGFDGGRSGLGREMFMTTSYDYGAPIGEGLCIGPKYHHTRLAHRVIGLFAEALVETDFSPVCVPKSGDVVFQRVSPKGTLLFVIRRTKDDSPQVTLHSPGGEPLLLAMGDYDAMVLPYAYRFDGHLTLDYTVFQPIAWDGRTLHLCGEAGAQGPVSIHGQKRWLAVPDKEEASSLEVCVGGVNVSLSSFASVLKQGEAAVVARFSNAGAPLAAPTLSDVREMGADPALTRREQLVRLEQSVSFEALGHHGGYGWYGYTFESDCEQDLNVFFPGASDRLQLYVDGEIQGVFGAGPDAGIKPIRVPVHCGVNQWQCLVDALGYRNSTLPLTDRKGIWRSPCVAQPLHVGPAEIERSEHPGSAVEPVWSSTRRRELRRCNPQPSYYAVSCALEVESAVTGNLWLSLSPMASFSWVYLNGELLKTHDRGIHASFADFILDKKQLRPRNHLQVIVEGTQAEAERMAVVGYGLMPMAVTSPQWFFVPWSPLPFEKTMPSVLTRDWPAWHAAQFEIENDATDGASLFIQCHGMSKGVMYLNGHLVGRYWQGSRQERYYLPTPWLKKKNEIVFYDERGCSPDQAQLVYRSDFVAEDEPQYHQEEVFAVWENNV